MLAGIVAHKVASYDVPSWARGLMPVLVIPLLATLVSGVVMVVVLARPLGKLTDSLNDGLSSLSGGSAIVLGIILGLMMAFDMGGPLNKVAYAFATTGLGAAATASDAPELKIMAAVMLAGMVPPIALALATVVRPGLFTAPERENGKAAWLMGASFITEGAIPFAAGRPAARDPVDHARLRSHRWSVPGVRRRPPGAARRRVRAVRRRRRPRVRHRPGGRGCRRRRQRDRPEVDRQERSAWTTASSSPSDQLSPLIYPRKRNEELMPTRSVIVGSAVGLHARPAAIISEAAMELDSEVLIGTPGDEPVDASSALLIMTLGAANGDTVEVSGDNESDVDAIAALVVQDLDAEDVADPAQL